MNKMSNECRPNIYTQILHQSSLEEVLGSSADLAAVIAEIGGIRQYSYERAQALYDQLQEVRNHMGNEKLMSNKHISEIPGLADFVKAERVVKTIEALPEGSLISGSIVIDNTFRNIVLKTAELQALARTFRDLVKMRSNG